MDRIDKDDELVCPLCGGRLFWMPASHIYACELCKQSYSERNGVYMKKKCNLTAEKSSAVGDAAKLREALKLCLRGMCGYCRMDAEARGMTTECVNGCEALLMAKAALAAPPRNCDVYTADELKVIFKRELASELPIANEHEKNLITITAMRMIDTLFSPATEKEGGNDGNK